MKTILISIKDKKPIHSYFGKIGPTGIFSVSDFGRLTAILNECDEVFLHTTLDSKKEGTKIKYDPATLNIVAAKLLMDEPKIETVEKPESEIKAGTTETLTEETVKKEIEEIKKEEMKKEDNSKTEVIIEAEEKTIEEEVTVTTEEQTLTSVATGQIKKNKNYSNRGKGNRK